MTYLLFVITLISLLVSNVAELKKRGNDSVALTTWKYFSYYTVLSNVLVLVWLTSLIFFTNQGIGKLAQNANVGDSDYLLYCHCWHCQLLTLWLAKTVIVQPHIRFSSTRPDTARELLCIGCFL